MFRERVLLQLTNDIFNAEGGVSIKHYVTLYILCELEEAIQLPQVLVPFRASLRHAPFIYRSANCWMFQVMEPDKCQVWRWIEWDEVREWARDQGAAEQKRFTPIVNLINTYSNIKGLDT